MHQVADETRPEVKTKVMTNTSSQVLSFLLTDCGEYKSSYLKGRTNFLRSYVTRLIWPRTQKEGWEGYSWTHSHGALRSRRPSYRRPGSASTCRPGTSCEPWPESGGHRSVPTCRSWPGSTCGPSPDSTCWSWPSSTCWSWPSSTCCPKPGSTCGSQPESTSGPWPSSIWVPRPGSAGESWPAGSGQARHGVPHRISLGARGGELGGPQVTPGRKRTTRDKRSARQEEDIPLLTSSRVASLTKQERIEDDANRFGGQMLGTFFNKLRFVLLNYHAGAFSQIKYLPAQ
jgi:hypothetical protein